MKITYPKKNDFVFRLLNVEGRNNDLVVERLESFFGSLNIEAKIDVDEEKVTANISGYEMTPDFNSAYEINQEYIKGGYEAWTASSENYFKKRPSAIWSYFLLKESGLEEDRDCDVTFDRFEKLLIFDPTYSQALLYNARYLISGYYDGRYPDHDDSLAVRNKALCYFKHLLDVAVEGAFYNVMIEAAACLLEVEEYELSDEFLSGAGGRSYPQVSYYRSLLSEKKGQINGAFHRAIDTLYYSRK